jgi:hypothetical protein
MKKYLISYIIFLFTINSFCSEIPIIDTTKVWSVLNVEYSPMGEFKSTHFFKFEDDTIIHDTLFYKIFESYDSTNSSWFFTEQFISENASKIFLRNIYGINRILYDFNLNVGDTITQLNMFDQEMDWKLNTIDSIFLEKTWHKRLVFGILGCGGCPNDIWIEGIGSLYGVTTPGNVVADFSTTLLCVKNETEYIYTNPEFNSCYLTTGIIEHSNDKTNIVFPNPFENYIKVNSDVNELAFSVINIMGQIVSSGDLQSNSFINLSHLDKGLYILRLKSLNDFREYKIIKK